MRPARLLHPRTLLGLTLALLAVQWAHALLEFGGAATSVLFGGWIYTAIGALAALTLLSAGLQARGGRIVWLILGAGLASKSLGDVIYSTLWNANSVPVPSVSDAFWLAFYPCAYLGLMLLVRGRIRSALAATRLDGVICGVAVAAMLACVTLPTAFSSSAGGSFWQRATAVAYPFGDLVLMGAVVSAVALSGWRVDRTLGVLAAAIVAWVAADLMYLFSVHGQAGDIADVLVLSGAAGMALAGVTDRAPRAARDDHERGLLVPVGFGAGALAILVVGGAMRLEIVGLSLAAVALGLVLIRMALALTENRALLGESRQQATTDALTGLGNRRKLKHDLAYLLGDSDSGERVGLVMLDLNGFKGYNDSFGHAAGDMLLAELGASLATAVAGLGEAYRLGGDEFCVLARCDEPGLAELSATCADALSTRGDGFSITAAHGAVLLPSESGDADGALALADERMYQNKASAGRPQRANEHARLLAAALAERSPALASRNEAVCDLAVATGLELGLSDDELDALRHAATLHDIGTIAIPDAILAEREPLSPQARQLIRQHPIVGERILAAAPTLRRAAQVLRGSHERYDGTGFPDALRADEIPLPSRIIAVAAAFAVMTCGGTDTLPRSGTSAIAELERSAGTQFDAGVIAALERALATAPALMRAA